MQHAARNTSTPQGTCKLCGVNLAEHQRPTSDDGPLAPGAHMPVPEERSPVVYWVRERGPGHWLEFGPFDSPGEAIVSAVERYRRHGGIVDVIYQGESFEDRILLLREDSALVWTPNQRVA